MKMKKFAYRKNIGLLVIVVGVALWFLPFVIVAISNILGTTRPADSFISNFGLLVITVSPILVLSGLLLTALRFTKR